MEFIMIVRLLRIAGLLAGIKIDYNLLAEVSPMTKRRAALIATAFGVGAFVISLIIFIGTSRPQFQISSIGDDEAHPELLPIILLDLAGIFIITSAKVIYSRYRCAIPANRRVLCTLVVSTLSQNAGAMMAIAMLLFKPLLN